MNNRKTAASVFITLCILCAAHAVYYYPQLPEVMAGHFGESGQADGWSAKTDLTAMYFITILFNAAVFMGLGSAIRKLPNWTINIPNRDYWLTGDKREKTLQTMSNWLLWVGSLTMLLFLDMYHQLVRVNLRMAPALEHHWISIGAYLFLLGLWSVLILGKFRRIDDLNR